MPTIRFTKQSVARQECPSGKKKIIFSDSKTKGLILEVRQSQGRTFYVRYRDEYGDQKSVRIGDATVIELSAARQKAIEILSAAALGGDPQAEKAARKNVPHLDEFFIERYLPHVKGYKRSWKSDESIYRNHIAPVFGRCRMDAITRSEVSEFHHGIRALGYAPGTANRVLVLLGFMFNLARKWRLVLLTESPTDDVELFRLNNERQRFLAPEEVEALFDELKRSPNKQLLPIVNLLLLTGARKREVLDAEWQDFDFTQRMWVIPKTKSGRSRKVPLSDTAISLVQGLPSRKKSNFLFPNPDTGRPFRTIFYAWDTARKRAEMADLRMHDLRHSFASFLVNSGRTLYEVQRLLGHANIKTTQRYAHLSDETLSNAVNVVGNLIKTG